jgi:ribonuclease P protein component
VSLRFVHDGSDTPPRVAFAVGRRAGHAVARNRIRRRLRAAVQHHASLLAPGGVYLFGGNAAAMSESFPALVEAVGTLMRTVSEERA